MSTAKNRQSAMNRFFKGKKHTREMCNRPCKDINVNGTLYTSFLNDFCFALTTEKPENMEMYDNSGDTYFNISRLVDVDNAKSTQIVDINVVLAEAKAKGYRYKQSELGADFQYAFRYKDEYPIYKIALIDKAFSIINDGTSAEVYFLGNKSPLIIKTSVGLCGILPVICATEVQNKKTVIKISN